MKVFIQYKPTKQIVGGFMTKPLQGKLFQKFRDKLVGMLLYLVKYSIPDVANAVRELSKSMDGSTLAGMKELKRVVKYAIDTEEYGLKSMPR